MTKARFLLAVAASLFVTIFPAEQANAAIVITRSELIGGQLRVEGQGARPNASISVNGTARGTADVGGRFRILVANFSAPTCSVTVSDGATSAAASLIGCTSAPPPPPPTSVIFGTSTAAGTVGAALSYQAVGSTGVGGLLAFVYSWGDGSTLRDPATGFYSAGAGSSVVGATVTHAWLTAGTFTVAVTAVDDLGRSVVSGPLSVAIVAATPPPPAPGQNDCNTGFDAGDTLATATLITLPVTCTGTKPVGDVDVYAMTATQPFQLLSVSVTGFFAGLDVYDPAGNVRLSTGLPFSGPTWVDICPTTPCQNIVTGRAFGFTVDMVGNWLLVVRDDVPSLPTNASYTLSAAFGGGGSDCLTGRDPALVPATVNDAPNEGPYSMTLLKRDVACAGSLPPTNFDTSDRYDFAVVAGEPVAVSIVPDVPTHPTLGEIQGNMIFPKNLALGLGGETFFNTVALVAPGASGNALLIANGPRSGVPPPRPLGYRLFVATGSNHTSDCYTGQDAPGSFALATPMLAPSCIGTVSAVDTEDWYRFPAALGEEVMVTRLPDGTGAPFGGPTVPLEVYDPDGIKRGTAGDYLIDKAGDWRIRVATDILPALHFEGNYGIEINRMKGVPGHDCNSGADAPPGGLLLTLPVQCQGDFMPFPDPSDAYQFALQAGQTVTISLTPNPLSDFPIALTDPTGLVRAQTFAQGQGVGRSIIFKADVTGTWRLDVTQAVLDGYDKTYSFSISATAPVAVTPQVSVLVTVPEAVATGDSVLVGQTFTVAVRLSNAGATATGTSLSLSWTPLTNARVQSPTVTTVAIGNLLQGSVNTFSWTMRADNTGSVTLTVTSKDAAGGVLASGTKILAIFK